MQMSIWLACAQSDSQVTGLALAGLLAGARMTAGAGFAGALAGAAAVINTLKSGAFVCQSIARVDCGRSGRSRFSLHIS